MKNIYLLLTLTVFFTVGEINAQYDQKLYNQLQGNLREAQSDNQKIKAYLALGDYHVEQSYMAGYQKSMDTAKSYAQKCERLSKQLASKKHLADTYLLYSKAYNYESRYEESIAFAKKAALAYKEISDNTGIFHSNRALFLVYRYVEVPENIIKLTEENLILAKAINDKLLLGMANEDVGLSILYNRRPAAESLKFYTAALDWYKQAGKTDLQYIYSYMAGTYSYLSEQDKALEYITMAIALAQKYNDQSYYVIDIYKFAGVTYRDIRNRAMSLKYFREAYHISKKYIDTDTTLWLGLHLHHALDENDNTIEAIQCLHELERSYLSGSVPVQGRCLSTFVQHYLKKKEYGAADKYYRQLAVLLPTIEKEKAIDMESFSQAMHASILYHFHYKNYKLSEHYIKLLKSTLITGDKRKAEFIYWMSFKIDSVNKEYVSAIKNYQVAALYKDSVFNETKYKQLAELQVQYQVAKKDRDNLALKQKSDRQESRLYKARTVQLLSFAAIVLLAIFIGLIYRLYSVNKKRRKETTEKNRALEKLVVEKEWLLREIHHRVKNNLQIVMSLLNTQSSYLSDAAAVTAIKDSQHRMYSMSLIHQKLYKTDNLAAIDMREYILELVEYLIDSFDTEFRIIFELQVESVVMDVSQAVPIGLILNEAVTNAIKYAFPDTGKGKIIITLEHLHGDYFVLRIADDGVGLPAGFDISKANSLGMKLIHGLSGDLEAEYTISGENGTTIELRFVYQYKTR